jgi:hypothetical protein
MTILHGNKKKSQLSKMHFNTMFGKRWVTSSEPISKTFFFIKSQEKINRTIDVSLPLPYQKIF